MDVGKHSNTMAEGVADISLKKRPRKKYLCSQILKQMEFYFSDANLTRDRYLSKLIGESKNVPLETFLRFNKIRELTESVEEIALALGNSQLLKLTENGKCVYRTTEIGTKENRDACMIYVEQLPLDANHDWVIGIFSAYGNVEYVSIPKYKNRPAIKGYAFVEFDTPEAVNKVLEAFGSAGCCLPEQMQPEDLCSISTFEGEETLKSKRKKEKLSQSSCEDTGGIGSDTDLGETDTAGPRSKKLKTGNDLETVKSTKGKKRKLENEDGEYCNFDDHLQIMKRKKKMKNLHKDENGDSTVDEGTIMQTDEDDGDNSDVPAGDAEKTDNKKQKRKRNRNKKKSVDKKENDPASLGLHIMPKKEWSRLRNKYLNLQREKMHTLKEHLVSAKFGSNYQSPYSQDNKKKPQEREKKEQKTTFTSGVIICIDLAEPLEEVDTFKKFAKSNHGVAYVDANEGASKVHIRCNSAEEAQHLIKAELWDKMKVLEGEAEETYWDKIWQDRESRMSMDRKTRKKQDVKIRGRKKLLKRAEQELGKYIKFNV